MMSDQFGSCVASTIHVEQMQLVRNLIEVKISEQAIAEANFNTGIEIQVRCEKPFTINAYWLVKIRDLHLDLDKDWKTMRDELWDNEFLATQNKCLFKNEPQIFQQSNEQVVTKVKPPKPIDTSSMTVTPRDFYPLVIIVTCHEEEPNPKASDAAANIHIVHIRDTVVPIKSHVIKQYIKQIDGRILDISQLYAEETVACFICFEEANLDEKLQLFCLLPCRHSPICSNCITRIRDCPKCRCPIASVFDMNSPPANSAAAPQIDPNISHLYDDNSSEGRNRNVRNGGFFASIKSMFGM